MEIKLKQYVFIPKSLNMSVGKAASQVAHATYLALSNQLMKQLKSREGPGNLREEWEENGMCVIVLEAKDPEHLNNISKYFEQWKIPSHLYIDEGLTEVGPMIPTALATGIVSEDKFWMFDQFKLFGSVGDAQEIIDGFTPTNLKDYPILGCEWCSGTGIKIPCRKCSSYRAEGL